MLPFGWFHVLRGLRRPTKARAFALGIRPEFQSRALGPLLYARIIDNLRAIPTMQMGEASWILATNNRMNSAIEGLGAERYKTWRMYQRPAS